MQDRVRVRACLDSLDEIGRLSGQRRQGLDAVLRGLHCGGKLRTQCLTQHVPPGLSEPDHPDRRILAGRLRQERNPQSAPDDQHPLRGRGGGRSLARPGRPAHRSHSQGRFDHHGEGFRRPAGRGCDSRGQDETPRLPIWHRDEFGLHEERRGRSGALSAGDRQTVQYCGRRERPEVAGPGGVMGLRLQYRPRPMGG